MTDNITWAQPAVTRLELPVLKKAFRTFPPLFRTKMQLLGQNSTLCTRGLMENLIETSKVYDCYCTKSKMKKFCLRTSVHPQLPNPFFSPCVSRSNYIFILSSASYIQVDNKSFTIFNLPVHSCDHSSWGIRS